MRTTFSHHRLFSEGKAFLFQSAHSEIMGGLTGGVPRWAFLLPRSLDGEKCPLASHGLAWVLGIPMVTLVLGSSSSLVYILICFLHTERISCHILLSGFEEGMIRVIRSYPLCLLYASFLIFVPYWSATIFHMHSILLPKVWLCVLFELMLLCVDEHWMSLFCLLTDSKTLDIPWIKYFTPGHACNFSIQGGWGKRLASLCPNWEV